jgi:hypothetical protein
LLTGIFQLNSEFENYNWSYDVTTAPPTNRYVVNTV